MNNEENSNGIDPKYYCSFQIQGSILKKKFKIDAIIINNRHTFNLKNV